MIGVALTGVALGAGLAVWARRDRARDRSALVALRSQLGEVQHESFQKTAQVANQRQELQLLRSRLGEADRLGAKLAMMTNDLSELRARFAEAEQRLAELPVLREGRARLEAEIGLLRTGEKLSQVRLSGLSAELARRSEELRWATDRLRQLENEGRLACEQLERERRVSRSLGLEGSESLFTLDSAAGRSRARGALAEAVGGLGADAAALCDGRGLVLVAAGHDGRVRTLARLSAEATALSGPMSALVGGAPNRWALGFGQRSAQLLALPGERWLGLESAGEPSLPTLQLLGLRLGIEPAGPPDLRAPRGLTPSPGRLSGHALAPVLAEWSARWAVEAVGLRWTDGFAGSPAFPLERLPELEPGFTRLLQRARWAGLGVSQLVVRAVGALGRCVETRWLELEDDWLPVLGLSAHPLAPEAFDELLASLRWAARSPQPRQVAHG